VDERAGLEQSKDNLTEIFLHVSYIPDRHGESRTEDRMGATCQSVDTHPGVSYKDALKQAKDSYQVSKVTKPIKPKKVTYAVAKVDPIVNSVIEEKKQTGAGMTDEVMEEMQPFAPATLPIPQKGSPT